MENSVCPIMEKAGYKSPSNQCDVPKLRNFLPPNGNCVKDGQCFFSVIAPGLRVKFAPTPGLEKKLILSEKEKALIASAFASA